MPEFFPYRDGELYAEAVPVARIAEAVGTPFYLYSAGSLTARYGAIAEAFALISEKTLTSDVPSRDVTTSANPSSLASPTATETWPA